MFAAQNYVFEIIKLAWFNHRTYFKNATSCSKCMWYVAMTLNLMWILFANAETSLKKVLDFI